MMRTTGNIYHGGIITVAQAFSPNPENPPFYVDLPFASVDGRMLPREPAYSAWQAHFPVNMARRHADRLQRLRGLRFDTGDEDEYTHIPITCREFSNVLTSLGVDHVFETYNGDHRNRLWGPEGRMATAVIPFFSRMLDQAEVMSR